MKTQLILSGVLAGSLFFAGCQQDCTPQINEAVAKEKQALEATFTQKEQALNENWQNQLSAVQAELNLVAAERDSLLALRTSGAARPASTTRPAAPKTTATPEPPKPADARESLKQSTPQGEDARSKLKGGK